MAVREGAAAAVLARQADMRALGAQRADRQRLGSAPIDPVARFERGALCFELAGDLAVEVKAVGYRDKAMSDFAQQLDRRRRVAAAVVVGGRPQPRPGPLP